MPTGKKKKLKALSFFENYLKKIKLPDANA
jgi:hypothetical protein